jgi:DNA-directed RNA polymerase subunit RPC12/RpoP
MIELKSCPKCGGKDILAELEPGYMLYICMDCGYESEPAHNPGRLLLSEIMPKAIELWNQREF